jgi:phytanoyl-CoA hydroxylase
LSTAWLALSEENENNGGLLFIPGSHRMEIAPEQLDALDFLRPELPQNQALCAKGISVPLNTGDVVLFHSGLFHAGGRNNTEQLKTALVLAYHGASNAPIPGTRSAASPDVRLD